jgi:uncharacterized protein YdeI (YjbR/CyaY-like superfamily)
VPSKPRAKFFATPAAFRAWLEEHHATASELLVGFYKKSSGKPSITWPESVDEALCFGWIDGVRKSLGAEAYTIRFTPRKPTSTWSAINVARVKELTAAGKMAPAGLAAAARRTAARTGIYAYERAALTLSPAYEAKLRANKKAAAFFDAQAPWYRRNVIYWITSAKREETRAARLAELIADSAAGRRIARLTPPVAPATRKRALRRPGRRSRPRSR